MAKLYNLARMSTATTGTGTITLGSAVTGWLSFAGSGVSNGETITYAIVDGVNREIGRGVYTSSGTTLSRTVLKSTNSNNPISLSGSATVFITAAAEDISQGPAFSAYNSIATSIPNTTNTKLENSNVEFDTASCYDASTNYRFTPNVAGHYIVTGGFTINGTSGVSTVHIYKNGTVFKTGSQIDNNISYNQATVSAIVYLNGSTDYIELWGYQGSGGTLTAYTGGTPNYGYFQAALIRRA
jgi:hypothetical protein